MATGIVGGATPFQSHYDVGCTLAPNEGDSALQINPAASLTALLGAIAARTSLLRTHLLNWAREPARDGGLSAIELAAMLEPLAEEAILLLDEAQRRAGPR